MLSLGKFLTRRKVYHQRTVTGSPVNTFVTAPSRKCFKNAGGDGSSFFGHSDLHNLSAFFSSQNKFSTGFTSEENKIYLC